MPLTLDTYRLLGRSGLRVSPLALGTATFGTEWGWGAEPDDVRKLFDTYVGRGGNFIDTAGTYTDGSSERLLGEFTRDNRESLVLATKCTTLSRPGRARSCTWRFPTFRRGWSAIVALQIEYSLVERTGERDLIPMARELGLGVVPYLPLASRVLTGKYRRDDGSGESTRRSFNADLGLVTERNLAIADVVQEVAAELECTPRAGRARLDAAEPGCHGADHRRSHHRPAGGQPRRTGGRLQPRPACPARRGQRDRPGLPARPARQ